MPRKRIDQVEGITQHFSTTSALLNYCYNLTESLPEEQREIVLDYLKLRNSGTWTKSQVHDLIALSRYEISIRKLSDQLSDLNEAEVLDPKALKSVTSLLSSLVNQAQQMRINLSLTITQLFGDARDRRDADQAQSAVIDILTPKALKPNELSGIDEMREKAKNKLLKIAS